MAGRKSHPAAEHPSIRHHHPDDYAGGRVHRMFQQHSHHHSLSTNPGLHGESEHSCFCYVYGCVHVKQMRYYAFISETEVYTALHLYLKFPAGQFNVFLFVLTVDVLSSLCRKFNFRRLFSHLSGESG